MKRFISRRNFLKIAGAAGVAGALTACGGSAASSGAAASSTASSGKATPITITGTNGKGDTQSNAHENFAAALNACGGWNATAMVSGEMGATDDVLEQAMTGAPVIAATDPSRLASYVPEFGILMMPYMFDSYDQLDGLMDTELYQGWVDALRQKGLVLLTNNCITGFRNYVTNREINTPADLKGLKIRTMGSTIAVDSVNAMGAIATALNQSEAYNAIETGVVDGGEWQIPTIYSLRMYEVCKNMSLTQHFLLTGSIVCGAAWYDALSEEQQEQLRDYAVQCYGDTKEMVMEAEEKYTAEMEAAGMKVTVPDKDAFRKATEHLYSNSSTTGGADFEALRTELYKQMGIA